MNCINNILDLIGNTPLYNIRNTNIYTKLECFNLTRSIKDRAVKQMLLNAKLKEGSTIIEPTSGNTGIALACLCNALKYKCIIVMNTSVTKERIDFIKAYGAEIVLVDASLGMQGCIEKAKELNLQIKDSYILDQFNNKSNVEAHYLYTGKEIYEQMDGKIDYFIAGIGTGGTISGVGKYLKEKDKNIKVIGIEPSKSSTISTGLKGNHTIFGIGAGFIPSILDKDIIDDIYLVDEKDAYNMSKRFIKEEGILVGISSGAALHVAYKIHEKYGKDKRIVCILPDSGDRYFSILN